ncbi:MAG: archease [Candidatus Brocadiae bacterium]|nr:archease [Candidatus Brocadiia bacterium]
MAPFTFFDHTGDIGVDLSAPTASGLFSLAGLALFEAIADTSGVRPMVVRKLQIAADSQEELLNRFLSALLVIFDDERLLLPHVAIHEMDGRSLRATAAGERFDPELHEGRTELKAVTWHALHVSRQNGLWTARVVFDV